MSPSSAESISVIDVPERSRFEITVDDTFAGYTAYVDADAGLEGAGPVQRTFPHTVMETEFGGRGLATVLITTALDAARVSDLEVVPECSFVQHFIAEHPDYLDLVPASRRAEFDL